MMGLAGTVVGVDCGGSTTRCAIATTEGQILAVGVSGSSNPFSVGTEQAKLHVEEAFEKSLADAGCSVKTIQSIHVGIADENPDRDKAYLAVFRPFPRVSVSTDIYAAWAGAGLLQPGTLLLAGTGSAAFTVNSNGDHFRRGGWGYLLGDEGSSYHVGVLALRQLLRTWEADDDCPFSNKTKAHLGFTKIDHLWEFVYKGSPPREEIAGLARFVDSLASQGEEVAVRILKEATDKLIQLVKSVIPFADSPNIWFSGGLFSSKIVVNHLHGRMKEIDESLSVEPAKAEPVIGSLVLAHKNIKGEPTNDFIRNAGEQLECPS